MSRPGILAMDHQKRGIGARMKDGLGNLDRWREEHPHGSNGSISMTIAVMSMEQGSIVTSLIEKSAD
jgi:hypothetical protein